MTATGHAVIGTVIAAKIGDPLLAIPIAFTSHFVADAIPHWDTGTHWRQKTLPRFLSESFVDVMVGYIVTYLLVVGLFPTTNLLYTLLIVTVAQLPDWVMAPYLFFHLTAAPFRVAYNLQHKINKQLDKPWGIINQIAILLLLLTIAKVV